MADERYAPAHRPAVTAEPRREIAEKPAMNHPAGVTGFVLSVDKVMRGGFRNANGGDHRAKAA